MHKTTNSLMANGKPYTCSSIRPPLLQAGVTALCYLFFLFSLTPISIGWAFGLSGALALVLLADFHSIVRMLTVRQKLYYDKNSRSCFVVSKNKTSSVYLHTVSAYVPWLVHVVAINQESGKEETWNLARHQLEYDAWHYLQLLTKSRK